MTAFGEGLRRLRTESHDTNGKRFSQKRFGELLQAECGRYFSGAAIHYWESGESEIHKDDRELLIAILRVLRNGGGLKSQAQAASLLREGNFRALNKIERQYIFPKDPLVPSRRIENRKLRDETSSSEHLVENNQSFTNFQKLVNDATEETAPAWPRITTDFMRKISAKIESANSIRILIWLLIWVISFIVIPPSLTWPFPNRQTAIDSMLIYVTATFILPLLLGLMTNTNENSAWKKVESVSPVMIRIYTYQGAFVGFHTGYFLILLIHLALLYLQIRPATWAQFIFSGFPLFMGTVAAHVIPDNLWKAYKRLWLSDGWVFFVFVLVGPFWAWFFLEYYLLLTSRIYGVFIIIIALLLSAWLAKSKQTHNIPN